MQDDSSAKKTIGEKYREGSQVLSQGLAEMVPANKRPGSRFRYVIYLFLFVAVFVIHMAYGYNQKGPTDDVKLNKAKVPGISDSIAKDQELK